MSDYLADDLDRHDRDRLERHAEECPDCAQVLETLEALIIELHGVRDTAGTPTAEGLLRSIRERLEAPLGRPSS